MGWISSNWILGLGKAAQLSRAAIVFSVGPRNTAVLAVGGEPLTIAVTAPAELAGSTTFAPSDLGSGPVDLLAPAVDGVPSVGATVGVRTALWAYDGTTDAPSVSWQWREDGVDIPGATQQSYTPTGPQAGAGLSVVETATGPTGARSVASVEATVAA